MRNGFIALVGAVLLLQAGSAFAETSWYLGAGGGLTKLKTKQFGISSGLDPAPPATGQVSSDDFSDTPFGWQVYGGVMFTENFGLVVKYSDSGKGKDQWPASATIDPDGPDVPAGSGPLPPVTTDYNFTGEMQMDGYTIYLTQIVPMGDKFSYGIELGWTQQDIEFMWDSTSVPSTPNSATFKRDDSSFAFGAVMRYKFARHFAVGAEFEWLLVNFGDLIDRPVKLNVNLEYHF